MTQDNSKESSVQAVRRSLMMLEAISSEREVGIRDIAKRQELTIGTAHRLVSTLEALGYVEQNPETLRYRASIKLFELGSRVIHHMGLKEQSRPFLEELASITGETAHLGVLDKGEVVYVDKIESSQALRMVSGLGTRAPAHCAGIGKILLAFLSKDERDRILANKELTRFTPNTITTVEYLEEHLTQVRQRGFAIDDEDLYEGIRTVAAAIRDHTGVTIAGISIAGPSLRITRERLPELGKLVKEFGDEISSRLGYFPPVAKIR